MWAEFHIPIRNEPHRKGPQQNQKRRRLIFRALQIFLQYSVLLTAVLHFQQ